MQQLQLIDILKYCLIILAALFIVFKGLIPGWKEQPADFNNYYVASKLLVEGEPIHQFYNNDWFNKQAKNMGIEAGAKFAPFPPVSAYVFLPLTPFSPLSAKRIWLVINCLLIVVLTLKTKKQLQSTTLDAILFVCLFTVPLTNNISFGQIYLLLTLALMQIVLSKFRQTKFIWSALILGLATAIKYVPILFATYFYNQQSKWKFWIVTLATITFAIFTIYVVDPLAYQVFLETFSAHLNGNLSGQGKYAIAFQSLDSMLNNLFVGDATLNPSPLINQPVLKPLLKILSVLTISFALLVLLKKSDYKLNRILISIGIVGSFIVFPATASYHFLILFLPLLILKTELTNVKKQQIIFTLILLAVFTIQFHHVPEFKSLPTFNLLIHYPRFWSLLLLFLFLVFNYSKLLEIAQRKEFEVEQHGIKKQTK